MGIFDKEIAPDHPLYQGGSLISSMSKPVDKKERVSKEELEKEAEEETPSSCLNSEDAS